MQEHFWWWPVALPGEAADGPVPLTLLGERMVLWQGPDGTPSLLADQCPHRGARLSMGKVQSFQQNPVLQCPYHGWQFDTQGDCVGIPALPGFCPPTSSHVRRFPVRETHGLIWAYCAGSQPSNHLRDGASLGPPLLHGMAHRRLIYGPFDIATSAPRAIENFLDTAHFAFVHANFLGDSAHPEVPAHEVSFAADGRPIVEHYRAWQPKAHATDTEGFGHERPGHEHAQVEDSYVIWANPSEPESCRLWFAQYTSDNDTAEEQLRAFQIEIFAQDRPILESQVPRRLPLSQSEAMSAADRLSAAYRRYLKDCGITFGVC